MSGSEAVDILDGTTRRVFRFVYRQRKPVGVHDIQRGLKLSSPSVVYYHIEKLRTAGLVKEVDSGFEVEKTVFENMIRVRHTPVPLQVAYATFYLASLVALIVVFRPSDVTALFAFALAIAFTGSCISIFEAYRTSRTPL